MALPIQEAGSLDGRVIAVMDDEELMRRLASKLLGRVGAKVHTASDDTSLYGLVRENRYDAIVLANRHERKGDIALATATQLVQRYGIPGEKILVYSSSISGEDAAGVTSLGGQVLIRDPLTPFEIVTTLVKLTSV